MLPAMFVGFFVMLVIGVPIAFAMAGSAILALVLETKVPLLLAVQRIYGGADSFALLAIPFFIIAGEVMTVSRMTDALVDLCNSLLGHLRSGLAGVTVAACVVFAGISGSGSADTAAIGSVMIPQLVARGYPRGLAASIVSCAGALGPIIPPSLLMIIYGAIAEQSIGRLFLAGILPGLMIGVGLFVILYVWNRKEGWEVPTRERLDVREAASALRRSLIPLGTPLVIVGGIVGGVFTATEAGVVAAVYALLSAYLYRGMKWSELREVFLRSGLISSLSLFIIAMAGIFSWILAREQFPTLMARGILSISGGDHLAAAALVVGMLLVLGTFLEVLAMMIIFVPILAPLGPALDIDPVQWGLVMVMTMNVGGITPPVGSNVFISASLARCRVGEVSRWTWPLVGVHAAVVFLTLIFPGLSLWIPKLAMG